MDATRFDHLARALVRGQSRQTRRALVLVAFLLAGIRREAAAHDCKNLNAKCKRSQKCCSGVCRGRKGRKRCKAHDTGGCPRGQDACAGSDACTTSTGNPGHCATTSGNAGYCVFGAPNCRVCTHDDECRPQFGPRAACLRCASCPEGTACGGPS
jgi:hypothetical protein